MPEDRFLRAIVAILHATDVDRAIRDALELIVDRGGAQLARLELLDGSEVAYALEHPAARDLTSIHELRHDIGVPAIGSIAVTGASNPDAVRDPLALLASALDVQADHILRPALRRPPPMLHEALRVFERRFVHESIHRHRGNMAATARALGISRSTLYELIKDPELSRAGRQRLVRSKS